MGAINMRERHNKKLPSVDQIHFVLMWNVYNNLKKYQKATIEIKEAYKLTASYFLLTQEESEILNLQGENEWESRVNTSYLVLNKQGLMKSESVGAWALTDEGLARLNELLPEAKVN